MDTPLLDCAKMQVLLDKVSVIDFKYQKTRQKNSFNIFNLLAKKYDEVNLHSKFIYELLNPNGSHGHGTAFLKLFLKHLNIEDMDMENIRVLKEHRNIDILIRNNKQAIVIENKLHAPDQYNQLKRYYDLLKSDGFDDVKVIYLTIDGKEPEAHSIGDLIDLTEWASIFITISYDFDIKEWITNCIKEAYDLPILRETLIQYKSLIDDITGKTMNNDEREEVLELIAEGNNILTAKKIAENWDYVKCQTELYFWNNLEEIIKKHHATIDRNKYSKDKIRAMIEKKRSRSAWYGVMFKINTYNDYDVCFFVERGWGEVYYGITVVKDDDREVNEDAILNDLALGIKEISEWGQEKTWLGGNFCEPRIDFEQFATDATLKLFNEEFRGPYIANLWIQIKEYVINVNNIIEALNNQL